MPQSLQNIIALLGLLVVGGLGYYLYYIGDASFLEQGNNEFVVSATEQTVVRKAAEFQRLIAEINAIELSYEIFDDNRFRSLVDYSTPLTTDEVGRPNPFLPASSVFQR